MDEYALDLDLAYPIWEVLHESMGFGKPNGHVPIRIAVGKVNNDWEPVVRYIADTLGVEVERVALDWETILAPHDLDTALGVIPKDTICGHRWQLAAIQRRAPCRVGSVLRDGDLHAVARKLAASSPTRPGRHGVPHRGQPEHDPRPPSGPGARTTPPTPVSQQRRWRRSTPSRQSSTPRPDSWPCHWPVRRS